MTIDQINNKESLQKAKFDTAKQIRKLLDGLRQKAEDVGEDPDEIETEVIELVTE